MQATTTGPEKLHLNEHLHDFKCENDGLILNEHILSRSDRNTIQ